MCLACILLTLDRAPNGTREPKNVCLCPYQRPPQPHHHSHHRTHPPPGLRIWEKRGKNEL
ncbi:hypothetical protein RHMOL_Rhmol05G0047200 [Rhododendron molle]|uniref:Uncharacterized protein n=1 Tax=Rhododendron molle TaxID=49168 RepID=A0ACC0NKP9_RHOML|nr:hypothetical protein RHMOL_Rhmol05G0047200 [Rhododendron molle]